MCHMTHGTRTAYVYHKCRCDECREANRLAQQQWRAANPDKGAAAAKRRYAKVRAVVDELKTLPCTDCGHTYPPECMDFDHIDDNKEMSVGHAVSKNWSIDRILREIKKCELVCANCHRIRTKQRAQTDVTVL
mgnify:CR=1 FL=1